MMVDALSSATTHKDFNNYEASAPVLETPTIVNSSSIYKSKRIEPVYQFTVTDAKIHQLLLGFLSAISFSVACLAISTASVISTLFIAIPSLLMSGALVWKICTIKDYQDPKQLELFRREARNEPFGITLLKHGLDNMLKFEIPAKEDFQRLYSSCVSKLSFQGLIDFYEKITAVAKTLPELPFVIPPPSDFRNIFEAETSDLTTCQIFENYDVKKLETYKIFSDDFIQKYNKYQAALESTKKRFEDLKKWRKDSIRDVVDKYIQLADSKLGNLGLYFTEEMLKIGISLDMLDLLPIDPSDSSKKNISIETEYNRHIHAIRQDFENICLEINTEGKKA